MLALPLDSFAVNESEIQTAVNNAIDWLTYPGRQLPDGSWEDPWTPLPFRDTHLTLLALEKSGAAYDYNLTAPVTNFQEGQFWYSIQHAIDTDSLSRQIEILSLAESVPQGLIDDLFQLQKVDIHLLNHHGNFPQWSAEGWAVSDRVESEPHSSALAISALSKQYAYMTAEQQQKLKSAVSFVTQDINLSIFEEDKTHWLNPAEEGDPEENSIFLTAEMLLAMKAADVNHVPVNFAFYTIPSIENWLLDQAHSISGWGSGGPAEDETTLMENAMVLWALASGSISLDEDDLYLTNSSVQLLVDFLNVVGNDLSVDSMTNPATTVANVSLAAIALSEISGKYNFLSNMNLALNDVDVKGHLWEYGDFNAYIKQNIVFDMEVEVTDLLLSGDDQLHCQVDYFLQSDPSRSFTATSSHSLNRGGTQHFLLIGPGTNYEGIYEATVTINYDQTLYETSAADNTQTVTFEVLPNDNPDLIIENVAIVTSPTGGGETYLSDTPITFNLDIRNVGNVNIDPPIELSFLPVSVIDTDEIQGNPVVQTHGFTLVAGGSSQQVSLELTPNDIGFLGNILTLMWRINDPPSGSFEEQTTQNNVSATVDIPLTVIQPDICVDLSLAAFPKSNPVVGLHGDLNLGVEIQADWDDCNCSSETCDEPVITVWVQPYRVFPDSWRMEPVALKRYPAYKPFEPYEFDMDLKMYRQYGPNTYHLELEYDRNVIHDPNLTNNSVDATVFIEVEPDRNLDFQVYYDHFKPNKVWFQQYDHYDHNYTSWVIMGHPAEPRMEIFNCIQGVVDDVGMVDVNIVLEMMDQDYCKDHPNDCYKVPGVEFEPIQSYKHVFDNSDDYLHSTRWRGFDWCCSPCDLNHGITVTSMNDRRVIADWWHTLVDFDTAGLRGYYRVTMEVNPSGLVPEDGGGTTNNKVSKPLIIAPITDVKVENGEARIDEEGGYIHVTLRNRLDGSSFHIEGCEGDSCAVHGGCAYERCVNQANTSPSPHLGPVTIGLFSIPHYEISTIQRNRLSALLNNNVISEDYEIYSTTISGDWNFESYVSCGGWVRDAYVFEFNISLSDFEQSSDLKNLTFIVDYTDHFDERYSLLRPAVENAFYSDGAGWVDDYSCRFNVIPRLANNGIVLEYTDFGIDSLAMYPYPPDLSQLGTQSITIDNGEGIFLWGKVYQYGYQEQTALKEIYYRLDYRIPGIEDDWQMLEPDKSLLVPFVHGMAGGTVKGKYFLPSKSDIIDTIYKLRLTINSLNPQPDLFPENNIWELNVTVLAPVDLVTTNGIVNATEVKVGDEPLTVTGQFDITDHHGIGPVDVQFKAEYNNYIYSDRRTIDWMEPGTTYTVDFNWSIRQVEGNHSLTFEIDPENRYVELDETNNVTTFFEDVTDPPRPDIKVSEFTIHYYGDAQPREIVSHDSTIPLQLSYTIINDGELPAENFDYMVIHEYGDIDEIDFGSNLTLQSGATIDVTLDLESEEKLSPGYHTYSLEIFPSPDPRDKFTSNNRASATVAVMPGAGAIDQAIFSGMHWLYKYGRDDGMAQLDLAFKGATALTSLMEEVGVSQSREDKVMHLYEKMLRMSKTGRVGNRFRYTGRVGMSLIAILEFMKNADTSLDCPAEFDCDFIVGRMAEWLVDNIYTVDACPNPGQNPCTIITLPWGGWGFIRGSEPTTWETSMCTYSLLLFKQRYDDSAFIDGNDDYNFGSGVIITNEDLDATLERAMNYHKDAADDWYFASVVYPDGTSDPDGFFASGAWPVKNIKLYKELYPTLPQIITDNEIQQKITDIYNAFRLNYNNELVINVLDALAFAKDQALANPGDPGWNIGDYEDIIENVLRPRAINDDMGFKAWGIMHKNSYPYYYDQLPYLVSTARFLDAVQEFDGYLGDHPHTNTVFQSAVNGIFAHLQTTDRDLMEFRKYYDYVASGVTHKQWLGFQKYNSYPDTNFTYRLGQQYQTLLQQCIDSVKGWPWHYWGGVPGPIHSSVYEPSKQFTAEVLWAFGAIGQQSGHSTFLYDFNYALPSNNPYASLLGDLNTIALYHIRNNDYGVTTCKTHVLGDLQPRHWGNAYTTAASILAEEWLWESGEAIKDRGVDRLDFDWILSAGSQYVWHPWNYLYTLAYDETVDPVNCSSTCDISFIDGNCFTGRWGTTYENATVLMAFLKQFHWYEDNARAAYNYQFVYRRITEELLADQMSNGSWISEKPKESDSENLDAMADQTAFAVVALQETLDWYEAWFWHVYNNVDNWPDNKLPSGWTKPMIKNEMYNRWYPADKPSLPTQLLTAIMKAKAWLYQHKMDNVGPDCAPGIFDLNCAHCRGWDAVPFPEISVSNITGLATWALSRIHVDTFLRVVIILKPGSNYCIGTPIDIELVTYGEVPDTGSVKLYVDKYDQGREQLTVSSVSGSDTRFTSHYMIPSDAAPGFEFYAEAKHEDSNSTAVDIVEIQVDSVCTLDVLVRPGDIATTPDVVCSNDYVLLESTVFNNSDLNATNVLVEYYQGAPELNHLVGSDYLDLVPKRGFADTSLYDVLPYDENIVYIKVTAPGEPAENQGNNQTFTEIGIDSLRIGTAFSLVPLIAPANAGSPMNEALLDFNVSLPEDMLASVHMKVFDAPTDLQVSVGSDVTVTSGDVILTWDGKDSSGAYVPDGLYRMEVEARCTWNGGIHQGDYVEVDNTPPFIEVTEPASDAVIWGFSNIEGTVKDPNYDLNDDHFMVGYVAVKEHSTFAFDFYDYIFSIRENEIITIIDTLAFPDGYYSIKPENLVFPTKFIV